MPTHTTSPADDWGHGMLKIAIYGKGGIGKSTITSNLAAAFAVLGKRVIQIGCDPKADSTINLLGGVPLTSVMGLMRDEDRDPETLDEISREGFGGVVCGGFAAPIREGYAEKVLIVTSGEKMALYAANNITTAVANFEDRGYAHVAGIVENCRNVEREDEKVKAFADEHDIPIVAKIPRSAEITRCEDEGMTVVEGDRDSEVAMRFLDLARRLIEGEV